MNHTILCVDDEIDNLDALERLLRNKYKVLKASSGAQGLSLFETHHQEISLIISDQRMPQLTGTDFLKLTIEIDPRPTRILLTGYTDIESVIEAVNQGQIYRYLNKPWEPVDLVSTVDRAIEKYEMSEQLRVKNIELEKAFSELRVLDQAKDQFMILINHELKTPLTSILSYSELLNESKLDQEQSLCVSRILKASEKLKKIIDDVLLILKVETRTLKINTRTFSSLQLVEDLAPDIVENMAKKKMTLNLNVLDKKIVGDLNFLKQVITRLLHNAVKYGFEMHPIDIKAEITRAHRIKFTLINRGAPISDAVIEKVTRPFFLDENVMNHSTGMGLGLTICHSIIKAHQSVFKIENISGGVAASFELPCL